MYYYFYDINGEYVSFSDFRECVEEAIEQDIAKFRDTDGGEYITPSYTEYLTHYLQWK